MLVTLTTTETLIAASYRHAQEASYGAEAALERALHDLAAIPDWSHAWSRAAGQRHVASTWTRWRRVRPDGRRSTWRALTAERQRESDDSDGPAMFGADNPQWRLFAHAADTALCLHHLGRTAHLPLYLVVWVADDESDGDGDPARDATGECWFMREAFGVGGARRAVEAGVARSGDGDLRVLVGEMPDSGIGPRAVAAAAPIVCRDRAGPGRRLAARI